MDPCLPALTAYQQEVSDLQEANRQLKLVHQQLLQNGGRNFGELLDAWWEHTNKIYEIVLTGLFLVSLCVHVYRMFKNSRQQTAPNRPLIELASRPMSDNLASLI